MPILDIIGANAAPFIAFAIGYVLCVLVTNWRVFRIVATIVVLGLIWQFVSLFQLVPPVVSNLVIVAALAPAWIGAAGGLLVRAYQLQQPVMTMQTRIVTTAIGFLVFALVMWFVG
jgi:tetrahydromethanopterin S-methyltransferase subunit F